MQWSADDIVIALSLGETSVGLVRMPDGGLLFPGRLERGGGGTVLQDLRPVSSRIDGVTAVAGLRPPGIERAIVIDDAGAEHEARLAAEAWVAIVGEAAFSEPLVRYEDAAGAIVALPLPTGERVLVADADAPCPICGSVIWIAVAERVHCARCGLRVGAGLVFMHFTLPAHGEALEADFDEDEDGDAGWEEEWKHERQRELASIRFPVYGLPGRTYRVGGVSSRSGDGEDTVRVTEINIEYPGGPQFLRVASSDEEHWNDDRLQDLLAGLLRTQEHVERSASAERVHSTHDDRVARRQAAQAPRETRSFAIDGEPERFAFRAVGDRWVAARTHNGARVRLSARGVEPAAVALAPLTEIGDARARRAAAGELLTRAEVSVLIDQHDLTAHREAILAAVRPGYRLHDDASAPHRIGGQPDLAPGEQWPHDAHGIPYTFVAQFDCSQLPPLTSEFAAPPWNHNGQLIRIFCALGEYDGGPCRALALACPPDAPLTRTPTPPDPDPWPEGLWKYDDERLRELTERPVRPRPLLTARVGWYVIGDQTWESGYDDFESRLVAGGLEPRSGQWMHPSLLGHASNEQGEEPGHAGPHIYHDTALEDWCTLFSLPTHHGMSFGDGGSLVVVIRLKDLAAGRYDRLATDTSTG